MEKIIIAEMKDDDGVKIITALTDKVYLSDVFDQVKNDLDNGIPSVSVRFYKRTQKWVDKIPEYQG